MRIPRMVWVGVVGCAVLVGLWGIALFIRLSAQSLASKGLKPSAVAAEPARAHALTEDVTGGRYWNDPSMDPEMLKKAFAPPPTNLPPEARPVPLNLMPSNKELQRMRREGAVAY